MAAIGNLIFNWCFCRWSLFVSGMRFGRLLRVTVWKPSIGVNMLIMGLSSNDNLCNIVRILLIRVGFVQGGCRCARRGHKCESLSTGWANEPMPVFTSWTWNRSTYTDAARNKCPNESCCGWFIDIFWNKTYKYLKIFILYVLFLIWVGFV